MNYDTTIGHPDSHSGTLHTEAINLSSKLAPVPSFMSSPSFSTVASTFDLSDTNSSFAPSLSLKTDLSKAESVIGKTVSVGRKRDAKKQAKEDLFATMSQEDRANYTCYID